MQAPLEPTTQPCEDPAPEDFFGFVQQGSSGSSSARFLQGAFHITPHLKHGGFLLMFVYFPPGCFYTHTLPALLLWQKLIWMCPWYGQMSLSSHVLLVWEGIKSKSVNSEIYLDLTRLTSGVKHCNVHPGERVWRDS